MHSDLIDRIGLTGLVGWRTSFEDKDLNSKIDDALAQTDPVKQAELYREIEKLYTDRIPASQPISQVTDSVAQRADIEGFQISLVWQTKLDAVRKQCSRERVGHAYRRLRQQQ